MKRKTGVKFVSVKASSPQIRRTGVPNLGRWLRLIWGGEYFSQKAQGIVAKYKKIQIQRTQNKSKTVFIPDMAHKQNLPPYQHKVCVPIWNISRIVSIVVFRETTSTEHTISVLFLISFRRIVNERNCKVSVRHVMECQTELDPGKPFSSVFLKDQEEHSTQVDWFWI